MNPKEKIRKILSQVFYTSDNEAFIDYDKAEMHEYSIILKEMGKEKKEKKTMDVFKFIKEVLDKYNYGIYYKVNPVQQLMTQDSSPLFRINSVDVNEVEENIIKEYELFTKKQQKIDKPSQEDSAANMISKTG